MDIEGPLSQGSLSVHLVEEDLEARERLRRPWPGGQRVSESFPGAGCQSGRDELGFRSPLRGGHEGRFIGARMWRLRRLAWRADRGRGGVIGVSCFGSLNRQAI